MGEKHHCRGCGREVDIETTRCPECGAVLERVVTESGGQPLAPFIESLVKDHDGFRGQLRDIRSALTPKDLPAAAVSVGRFRTALDRHVVDEEARVLKVLIEVHGRDGAGEAIRTMQQHRPIRKRVDELAEAISSHAERAPTKLDELATLAEEHFRVEEDRVFPWAIETQKKRAREP